MSASFLEVVDERRYDFELKQDLRLKSSEVINWIEDNFDYWFEKKNLRDKLGNSFEYLDLTRFTNEAIEFAKENSLRFWECIDEDEDEIIGLKDMEMMNACACQIFCPHIKHCLGFNQINGSYNGYSSDSEYNSD